MTKIIAVGIFVLCAFNVSHACAHGFADAKGDRNMIDVFTPASDDVVTKQSEEIPVDCKKPKPFFDKWQMRAILSQQK
ncbi:MAG: hypothetical protein CR954_00020 [Candidatus Moraniibacteriota bacterium]|nr:MAG: hypothetical protein CR954_00020 [Candidatus Moranbacteria bacterium]